MNHPKKLDWKDTSISPSDLSTLIAKTPIGYYSVSIYVTGKSPLLGRVIGTSPISGHVFVGNEYNLVAEDFAIRVDIENAGSACQKSFNDLVYSLLEKPNAN